MYFVLVIGIAMINDNNNNNNNNNNRVYAKRTFHG